MGGSQGLEKEGWTLKTRYRVSPAYPTRKFYHLEFAWQGSILGFSVPDHEITRGEVYETYFYPRFLHYLMAHGIIVGHSPLFSDHEPKPLHLPATGDRRWGEEQSSLGRPHALDPHVLQNPDDSDGRRKATLVQTGMERNWSLSTLL